MEKPVEKAAEKRFDVRIPTTNTQVLDMLTRGSERTGVPEGRLIVVLLTAYAELTQGGLIPLVGSGPMVTMAQPSTNGNGHQHIREGASTGMTPVLDSAVIDSFLNDD